MSPFQTYLTAFLLSLTGLLASAPLGAQIIRDPTGDVAVQPATATVAGTINVSASRLPVGSEYRVRIYFDSLRFSTVLTISNGDGSFSSVITVPELSTGNHSVELRVDGVVHSTAVLKVVAPVAFALADSKPTAGATVGFSILALTEGKLAIDYQGRTIYGPVAVDAGPASGKLTIPTDNFDRLPASLDFTVRNLVGKLTPRVGQRTYNVQPPDTRPTFSLASSTLSTTTPTARTRFTATGAVNVNGAVPATAGRVDYWFRDAQGRVQPMGATLGGISADGSFSLSMRTPSLATMASQQAAGSGSIFTVTHGRDELGRNSQAVGPTGPGSIALDVDPAIDLNLRLRGPNGEAIEGARVELSEISEALFDTDSNSGAVGLGGAYSAGLVTQYDDPRRASDELLGCPATLDRRYTDASGAVEFEFDVGTPPQNCVGNQCPPAQVTIAPSADCYRGPDNNTPGYCNEVDPAGIRFVAVIRAAGVGFGYLQTTTLPDGQNRTVEKSLRLETRIDRYTGLVEIGICLPDQYGDQCEKRQYNRSANLTLTLPKISGGLVLSDPIFRNDSGFGLRIESEPGANQTKYQPVADLTPFAARAGVFDPAAETWKVKVHYDAGIGRPLDSMRLSVMRPSGGIHATVDLARVEGGADCDADSASEVWEATLPASIADGFRFPKQIYGSGYQTVNGFIVATDMSVPAKNGAKTFKFSFEALAGASSYATAPTLSIKTGNPHARKIAATPPAQQPRTQTDSVDLDGRDGADVEGTDNRTDTKNAFEICAPRGAQCGAISSGGGAHRQYNRTPSSQPDLATQALSGLVKSYTGPTGCDATDEDCWETLFDKTIPLFRWYWGVPELLSAKVFADLSIRAQYLLAALFDPLDPVGSKVQTGGRMGIGIIIGVDIDVLLGILIDAGAAITGVLTGEVVATAGPVIEPRIDECLKFRMDFSGWLEIGCPIDIPFDPTCWIPDIEENYNIINETVGGVCASDKARSVTESMAAFVPSQSKSRDTSQPSGSFANGQGVLKALAAGPLTVTSDKGVGLQPLPRSVRAAVQRAPAIAISASGKRLVLNLDREGQLVAREGWLKSLSDPVVISTGYGIRDTAVTFFDADQAVAVWAATAYAGGSKPNVSASQAAKQQRLVYSIYSGSGWSAPKALTGAGFGDGGVRIARCVPRPLFLRTDCTSIRATVVFQRNLEGTIGGRKGIYAAHFNGSTFATPIRVDETGDYNITPTVAWQSASPLVAWVRYDPGASFENMDARRIAMRLLDGSGREFLPSGYPTRVAQPSLARNGANGAVVAFTRAAANDGFIGTRQSLYLGTRSCVTSCSYSSWQARDEYNRPIYVERPSVFINGSGEAVLTYRGLAYGAIPGVADPENNIRPGDPVGIRTTTGELMQWRGRLDSRFRGVANALTNDGGWHAQPTAAFDPLTGNVVALSLGVSSVSAAALASVGSPVAVKSFGQSKAIDEGLVVSTLADLPDPVLEALTTTATELAPGSTVPVRVIVRNRGSGYSVSGDVSATVRLRWSSPEAGETPPTELILPSLAAGASTTVLTDMPVPAFFEDDEMQGLSAELIFVAPDGEIDGSNNTSSIEVGGLPVPTGLLAASAPGTRFVTIAWADPADARVAGYRVYADDVDGTPRPLGSSFNLGFADLTAQFGKTRTYRVTSYSKRGVESALSEPIVAEPPKSIVGDGIFRDGF